MSVLPPPLPPARWWHAEDGRKVACTLCPRQCRIPPGGRGFCFVRANVDGRMELSTYGRSSGFCIDPVEKKPLNHFLPGTPILSFGTAGCNLACKFCQNWDLSRSRETDTLAHRATPEAIVAAAVRTGCRSLAFTYNDPVIWAEYAVDIARAAHARGLKTVAVTAGYIGGEARGEFFAHIDAANVDLKAFTDTFYRELCQGQLAPVLDTLIFLKHETQVWFELTNLLIPGANDTPEETKALCGWVVDNLGPDVPVHFSAFHGDFQMRQTPATPAETLLRARRIALAAGIRYAFVGNVHDAANQSTYCHACGQLLIQRDSYRIGAYHLRGRACGFCGAAIPGVFDDAGPGDWGGQRRPITIADDADPPPPPPPPSPAAPPPPAPVPAAPQGSPATAPQALVPQIDFSPEQDAQILAYARAIIAATLRGQFFAPAALPEPLAQAPAYGLFVSLFRGTQLRSCKGRMGAREPGHLPPLSQLLALVARDAATNDPRFPQATAAELPYLTVEISLLHSPQTVTARGADRIASVHVGTHGLVITHPDGHGLLLPHVAVEARWDARTFLEHTCRKAGLPPDTWRDDAARLMTFRARKITSPAPTPELDPAQLGTPALSELLMYIHQFLTRQPANPPPPPPPPASPAPTPAPPLQQIHPETLGLCLQTASGIKGLTIGPNHSLLSLAQAAAQSLASALAQRAQAEPVQTMTLLWQPLTLVAADYPGRHQLLAHSAVLAQAAGRWSLVIPQPQGGPDPIAEALATLKITHQQWRADRAGQIAVTAFQALHCQNPSPAAPPPPPAAVPANPVRPAFRAGTFYPADPAQVAAEVDAYLRAADPGQAPQPYRAIMLPHAGWRFCGHTLGQTLAAVKLPQTLIILGPRHTPLGPAWSLASHTAWQIPGATIPVATALVARLRQAVPTLPCEPEAHRQEHCVEVLLPFLRRLRPDLRIVPIVLGQCTPEMLAGLARALAALLREAQTAGQEPPLLVISSDMNHFAPETENRRRDALALDALKTGDPRLLYDTCVNNDISMCGLLPAVTVLQALRDPPSRQDRPRLVQPRLVDYTTSAAASGDASRVVGYAGVVIP